MRKNDGVLATPTDLKIENEILSWKNVDGAVGYTVKINDVEYETEVNELDLFTITFNYTTYNIEVMALGNFEDSFDSDWSTAYIHTINQPDDIGFKENVTNDGYVLSAVGEKNVYGKLIVPAVINEKPVTEICADAFKDCTGITSVLIPNSVTTINARAFSGCTNLRRVQLPNQLQIVETNCFYDCKNLTDVQLPNGITKINYGAFQNCESLTNITLPNSLVNLFCCCFEGCKSLKEITIPESVEKIGRSVFSNCDNLSTVTVDKNNRFFTSETNCIFAQNDDTTVLYGYGSNCVIPSRTKRINTDCFSGNTALNSIIIPENVQTIGDYAFSRCVNLKSIVFNEGLVRIGDENLGFDHKVFYGCNSLTSLHLPSSLEYLEGDFCSGADNLKSLTVDKDNKIFKSDGNCIIRKDNDELVAGCAASVIPNYVKKIGKGAFGGCKIKSIELPKNLTAIGEGAFFGSTIEKIQLPESLISIENSAFSSCLSLHTVNLPSGLKKIGRCAFASSPLSEGIAIPKSVTEIGGSAFMDCRLWSVTLPSTVSTIESRAFDLEFGTIYTDAETAPSGWFFTQDVDYNIGYCLPWNGYSTVVYSCSFQYTDGIPYVYSVVGPDSPYYSPILTPHRNGYDFEGWSTDKDSYQIVTGKTFTTLTAFSSGNTVDAWITLSYLDENIKNIPPKTILYAVWTKKTG